MVRTDPTFNEPKKRIHLAVYETAEKRRDRLARERVRQHAAVGSEPGALMFVSLVSISLIGPLALHMFLPVLPHVRSTFAVDAGSAQLAFSLAMLAMAVATLFYGSLSDRYGRLPMLVGGISLFVAGAFMAMFAPSIGLLILGRVIQGVGAADCRVRPCPALALHPSVRHGVR